MTHAIRPTTGNTAARNRFNPDRPTTYVAVYNDGSHGPERETREQAEADYTERVYLSNPDGITAQELTHKSIHEQAAALAAKRDKDESAMRESLARDDRRREHIDHAIKHTADRDSHMQRAREWKARMQESSDPHHIDLVYLPEIRKAVEKARGANYAALMWYRVARCNDRETWQDQARRDLDYINGICVTKFHEITGDLYQTGESLGGYQASVYMRRNGTYWAQVRNVRRNEDVSDAYFETLRDAAQWAVWEIKDATRLHAAR